MFDKVLNTPRLSSTETLIWKFWKTPLKKYITSFIPFSAKEPKSRPFPNFTYLFDKYVMISIELWSKVGTDFFFFYSKFAISWKMTGNEGWKNENFAAFLCILEFPSHV